MLPVQITIKDIPNSESIEMAIRNKASKLTQFNRRINSCRVVVESPQKHKHQGKLYSVCIDITVPGKEIAVTHKRNEKLHIVLRDAFNAAVCQLKKLSQKRHGRVKTHQDVLHGHIMRLVPEDGYGFIEGDDGNEYYFSMTNVSYPQFKQLVIGDSVEYSSHMQGEGKQAHHVIRERQHNHVTE